MDLEKETEKIRWYRNGGLRIKQIINEEDAQILVSIDGYNVCFKLMMFDFVIHAKEDLALDVKIEKIDNSQRIFRVNARNATELVSYIDSFISEWNIKISPNTVSVSDTISDDSWYYENVK